MFNQTSASSRLTLSNRLGETWNQRKERKLLTKEVKIKTKEEEEKRNEKDEDKEAD